MIELLAGTITVKTRIYSRGYARVLHLLLPCLLTFFTVSPLHADNPSYGGTLNLATIDEPETLNPVISQDTSATIVWELVFNSLTRVNERMEPVGDLAESWSVSGDGLTWRFNLKNGVLFHDGTELTAEDVVFTYNAIRNPKLKSPKASYLAIIESVEAEGRYTVVFKLKSPYASFPYLTNMEILPARNFRILGTSHRSFGEFPVGTGPFIFDSREKGVIVLRANERYFEGRPYIDRVVVKVYPSRESAWVALLRGEIHLFGDVSWEDYRFISDDPGFIVQNYSSVFYYTLLFNIDDHLFKNREMRIAIDYAIDREDLVEIVLHGHGVPTTGPFMPGTWPYNPGVTAQQYRPEKSMTILDNAGWKDTDGDLIREKDGEELTIPLLIPGGDIIFEETAKRIKWHLFQVGIFADIKVVSLKDFFEKHILPGDFKAALIPFNTGTLPKKGISTFWHSDSIGRTNYARYRSGDLDRLVDASVTVTDQAEREKLFYRIHRIIAEDRPAVFLYFRKRYLAVSSKVGGVKIIPQDLYHSVKEWYIK